MCDLRRKVQGMWPVSVRGRIEGILLPSKGCMNPFLQSIHSTLSVALTGRSSCRRPNNTHVCSS